MSTFINNQKWNKKSVQHTSFYHFHTFCNIDLYDSVKRKFEDLEVNVPKDYEKILIQNYGNNWKVPNPNWKNNVNLKQTQHLGLYDMYYCCCKDKSKKK